MAKKAKTGIQSGPVALLKITAGLFFIVLGFLGVLPNVNEGAFTLNDNRVLEVVFGIIELLCGVFVLASVFTFIPKKNVSLVTLVVLIFWIIRIVLTKILWRFPRNGAEAPVWLLMLCAELVIAAAVFQIYSAES